MTGDGTLLDEVARSASVSEFLALSLRGMASVLGISEQELSTTYSTRNAVRQAICSDVAGKLVHTLQVEMSKGIRREGAAIFADAYLEFARRNAALVDLWRTDFLMYFEERGSTEFWKLLTQVIGERPLEREDVEPICVSYFAALNGWVIMQVFQEDFTDVRRSALERLLNYSPI